MYINLTIISFIIFIIDLKGWGAVWRDDDVPNGAVSDPFLMTGFDHKVLHVIRINASEPFSVDVQVDVTGTAGECACDGCYFSSSFIFLFLHHYQLAFRSICYNCRLGWCFSLPLVSLYLLGYLPPCQLLRISGFFICMVGWCCSYFPCFCVFGATSAVVHLKTSKD